MGSRQREDSLEELALRVEEEVRRVLERLLGRRASSYFITVKLAGGQGELEEATVEVAVNRAVPGVDLDAAVEEAVEAARHAVREILRAKRGGRGGGPEGAGQVYSSGAQER